MWKHYYQKEEQDKFCSMVKGLELEYISSIPVSESMADLMSYEQFKDPYLVAKNIFNLNPRSPQYEKKNVFGNYTIKTKKQREADYR
jgi:hypothetical protein